jgi:uncharacterized membrane protein YeaQ/YmgE (transglycosylase-associated protein family)
VDLWPIGPGLSALLAGATPVEHGHLHPLMRALSTIQEDTMTITGLITALVIGAVIGALGRLILPGRQNIPIWLTIVVGVVAALLGTLIAHAVGIRTTTPGIDWLELLVQLALAVVGVAIVAGLYHRRGVHR